MDETNTIARLRRDEALRTLPDGTEAVPVTLQYQGSIPSLPRAERKQWLQKHFTDLYGEDMQLDVDTVSPSGQTVQALCPVTHFDEIRRKLETSNDRLDIVRSLQVLSGQ